MRTRGRLSFLGVANHLSFFFASESAVEVSKPDA